MSTIAPAQPMTSAVHRALSDLYRINVREYERIVAAGVLDGERVELIDGREVGRIEVADILPRGLISKPHQGAQSCRKVN